MYTFIINPASRSGLGRQVWESLEPILRERGVPYRAYLTRCQRHATRLARELTADGKIHTIVVLGGDGTVNEVIGGIQNLSATTLAISPSALEMISPDFSASPPIQGRLCPSYWIPRRTRI